MNRINFLPDRIFHSLTSLEEINLGNNKLETLPETIFSQLAKLKYLDLQSNLLKSISRITLKPLSSVEIINLKLNHFDYLLDDAFDDLKSLKSLQLEFGIPACGSNKDHKRFRNINFFKHYGCNHECTVSPIIKEFNLSLKKL